MRDEPYGCSGFAVDLGAGDAFGVASVEGLSAVAAVVDYRVGSETAQSTRKSPGLVRYDDLVLRRGIDGSDVFWSWWHAVATGQVLRRDVVVTLLDESRQPVLRWHVRRAWPRGYAVGPLVAETSEVATETLTLAHEGFTAEAL